MSGFEDNFFGDADDNPFNDPAIQQATKKNTTGLEEYAPFGNDANVAGPRSAGPAIMHPTTQDVSPSPPQYSRSAQQTTNISVEELERQRRELEMKKAALDRREEELRNSTHNIRKNNWPPLPDNFCVQPCFYQDINLEIPMEFQRIVRHLYYLWLFHGCVMILNVIGGLALLIQFGDFTTFGVGIIYVVLFTPFSFLCWYRPIYKAFRSDSSFNFMVFFFVFFFQFIVTVILAIGMTNSGTCGFLKAIKCFDNSVGGTVVGIIVLMIALCFIALAGGELLLLSKVHSIYRSSGASFAKAQQEFTKEFLRNEHVQNVSSDVAAAAIRSQLGGQNQQPNRY